MKNQASLTSRRISEQRIRDVVSAGVDKEPCRVCLVRMPYPSLEYPSLALGLLNSCLNEAGISCSVIYADLLFAEIIGMDAYRLLNIGDRYDMIGEWTFTGAAFPEFETDNTFHLVHAAKGFQRIFTGKVREEDTSMLVEELREIRDVAGKFSRELAASLLKKKPGIVGCSSTFEQQVPSLGLLKCVRDADEDVVTVLGGANCEGQMGAAVAREFPWVDVVFSGEVDDVFAPLCNLLMEKGRNVSSDELPFGAINRETALELKTDGGEPPRAVVKDINLAPVPRYSHYYETLRNLKVGRELVPGMLIETSRGCWWGEKSGCTFCGLNGRGRKFRSKSPERVLEEFDDVTSMHGMRKFGVTDCILDMDYLKTVFPVLAERGAPYSIFYETKANISRNQVNLLYDGGVRWFQPGIEGLHDGMLDLMNKGTNTAINVQTLKYASEFGMHAIWHLLVGFPGENDDWHLETAEWLPMIYHLQPVQGVKRIRYDRFCQYQMHPERYGIAIEPFDVYKHLFPVSEDVLTELAYYFRDRRPGWQYHEHSPLSRGVKALRDCEKAWARAFGAEMPALMSMKDNGDSIDIFDTRPCAPERRTVLKGALAAVYRSCDPATGIDALMRRLSDSDDACLTATKLEACVEELKERKLLIDLHGQLLSLAVPGILPDREPRNRFPCGSAPVPSPSRLLKERRAACG